MALSVHRPVGAMGVFVTFERVDVTPFPSTTASMVQAGANPDDVSAEDGGAPWVASPVRSSIFTFVHGRGPNDFQFILDSGASVHATGRYYLLKDMEPVAAGQSVTVANGKPLQIRGRGRVSLENFINLEDVDYIPGLISNIVSVSKLAELDYKVNFKGAGFVVKDRVGGALVGSGRLVNGVYVLDYLFVQPGRAAAGVPQEPATH